MTEAELKNIAQKLWESERENSAIVATKAATEKPNPLPPGANLPGMVFFLSKLQRMAFFHGVTAAVCAFEQSLQRVKEELDREIEELETDETTL